MVLKVQPKAAAKVAIVKKNPLIKAPVAQTPLQKLAIAKLAVAKTPVAKTTPPKTSSFNANKGWGSSGYGGWGAGGSGGGELGLLAALLGGGGGGFGNGGKGGGKHLNKFKIDKSGGELGEFTGKIKSFNWKTNYGFIDCAETAEYGDVFLHGDMKKGYQEGQTVKFECVLNKDGKPVAINLRSGLKGAGASSGNSSTSGKSGGFEIDKSGGELGEFIGKIKSFNWNTSYGFIECPELAEYGDVFLHASMIKGFRQGQKVKFEGVLNKDGKPVALNLKSGLK